MKTITFDKNGGPLKVVFKFEGAAIVGFEYTLFEANGRDEAEDPRHDKIIVGGPTVFEYALPTPTNNNDGRKIRLKSKLKAVDLDNFSINYKITGKVFQGIVKLGEEVDERELSSSPVNSLIRINLKSN